MAVPGIATAIEAKIDALVLGWTNGVSAAFAGILLPLATAGFTVYIILLGWQIMRGEASDPVHVIVKRLLTIFTIGGLALTFGLYQTYVINAVTAAQGMMIQAINASPINGGVPIALTIGNQIDGIGTVYSNLYDLLAQNFVFLKIVPNFAIILAAIITAVAEFVVVIVAVGIYLIAKIELSLCLAIGPFFVLLAVFEQTRDWTKRWIGQLFHYVIQVALIAATISLLQADLLFVATKAYNNYQTNGGTSVFADVMALFIISVVCTILIKNIGHLASALTGAIGGIGHDSVTGPVNRFPGGFGQGAATWASRGASRAWGAMRGGNSIAGSPRTARRPNAGPGVAGDIPAAQHSVLDNLVFS